MSTPDGSTRFTPSKLDLYAFENGLDWQTRRAACLPGIASENAWFEARAYAAQIAFNKKLRSLFAKNGAVPVPEPPDYSTSEAVTLRCWEASGNVFARALHAAQKERLYTRFVKTLA